MEENVKLRKLADGSVRELKTGRFAKGVRGRPGDGHITELKRALTGEVSVHDIHDIMRRMIELAKDGSVEAAKLVFDRCFGKLPNNLKLVEEKNLSVNIRNLSPEELDELERLALRAIVPATIEAEAVVVKGDDE